MYIYDRQLTGPENRPITSGSEFQAEMEAYKKLKGRFETAGKEHKQTFVRTGGTYAPEHPVVPKGQLQRHLEFHKTPWSRLPQGARIVAEAALKGQLRNPIGLASEFGSTYVYFHDKHGRYPSDEEWRKYTDAYARRKKWVWVGPIPGLNQKDNALFIQAAVAKLSPDTVRVVPPQ